MSPLPAAFAAALAFLTAATPVAPAKDPADAFMKKGLDALKANDYAAFIKDGTPKLKSLPKPSFALVSAHFGPMLAKGYKTTYLTRLRKQGHAISLWKLEPEGAAEDFELKVIVEDGKVDAFSIQ